jgi:hypothetical protein
MSKNIALTAFRQQYNYKVSIVQEKCNDLSFIELTKLAREVALYADKKSLSDDVIVYDPNISYQKENQTQILQDIEDSIANQSFSCRYTPILNSKDGTIVGYDSELFSLKSIVGSIHDMQDYAYNHQIIDELNKALYLELYQPYSINEALQNSKQFLTMDLNISIYQSYIRMVHSVTTPKNIKTLFIIKDTSLIHLDSTEVTNILNVLHENEMITALELTSTSLFLNAGIYRSFNYFVLRSESFTNLIVSQNLPLFADMISRINIASRNAKIFALGIEKWSIIDILARMNITYISSAEFNVGEKKLPVIDARRQARLIQIRQK